ARVADREIGLLAGEVALVRLAAVLLGEIGGLLGAVARVRRDTPGRSRAARIRGAEDVFDDRRVPAAQRARQAVGVGRAAAGLLVRAGLGRQALFRLVDARP